MTTTVHHGEGRESEISTKTDTKKLGWVVKEWRKIAMVRSHEGVDIRFALCIWITQ